MHFHVIIVNIPAESVPVEERTIQLIYKRKHTGEKPFSCDHSDNRYYHKAHFFYCEVRGISLL